MAMRKPLAKYDAASSADKVAKHAPAPPWRFFLAFGRIAFGPAELEALGDLREYSRTDGKRILAL